MRSRPHGAGPVAALAVAAVIAAALLLWEGRGLTLFVDEWAFGYMERPGWSAAGLFAPDNGHLALVPIVVNKAWLALFGATTTLPLRLLAIGLHIIVAILLYAFLRRDLGEWEALPPTVLVLFLGSTADIFLGSHAMPIQLSVATGLGALLAVGRERPELDALAAGLLTLGVASNGFALPFVIAVAVAIFLSGARRRRFWIVAIPIAAYALWWLAEGHGAESGFAARNVAGIPAFAFDSLAAALAALTGLFPEPGAGAQSFVLGPGQALAGIALVAAAVLLVRGSRPPAATLAPLAALLALWVATALVAGPARQPFSARYVYPGVILALMAAAPLIGGLRARREASIALAAVCAIALLPNLRELGYAGDFFRLQSDVDRATLGAVDLLGAPAPEALPIEVAASQAPGAVDDMRGTVGDYRESRWRYGTPALSPAGIAAAPPLAREAADRLIARALGLGLRPAGPDSAPLPIGIDFEAPPGTVRQRRGCLEFRPALEGEALTLALPPGGIRIVAEPGTSAAVSLRRFGDGFAIAAGTALGGRPAELAMPPGPAAADWFAQLSATGRAEVCGRRGR